MFAVAEFNKHGNKSKIVKTGFYSFTKANKYREMLNRNASPECVYHVVTMHGNR